MRVYQTAELGTSRGELGFVPSYPALKAGQETLRAVRTAARGASHKVRKRIEEIFGCAKTAGWVRKTCLRGVERTHAQGRYAVWNILCMANLMMSGPSRIPPA